MRIAGMGGRWWVPVLLVVVGGVGLTPAWAQPAPDPAGSCAGRERFLTPEDREAVGRIIQQRLKGRLGLSDQQAGEIRTLLQSWREEGRADVQALCQARRDLRQMLERQAADPGAIRAVAERVKDLQGKLLDRRLETQIALRSVLTPEQWAKWLELRQGRGPHRPGRGRGLAS